MCQWGDFPVHQHHWHLYTLPSRGVSETGLQGDQRIHPSQNTPSEREPAAGWQALEYTNTPTRLTLVYLMNVHEAC